MMLLCTFHAHSPHLILKSLKFPDSMSLWALELCCFGVVHLLTLTRYLVRLAKTLGYCYEQRAFAAWQAYLWSEELRVECVAQEQGGRR